MGKSKMKKEITIGFRTDKEIRDALDRIADEKRQTLSAVIETILYNYLTKMKAYQGLAQDQRKSTRKEVSLPAFIMDPKGEMSQMQTGKVLDISLEGIRLSVPQEMKMEINSSADSNEFHLIFTLPEATRPINMKCKSQRVAECGDNFHIGATFVDSDFSSYQTLQRYLI